MEMKIMKASLLALAVVLAAMVASPAFAKAHPECEGLPAPPGHEKHADKHCGADVTPPEVTVTQAPGETLASDAVFEWTGSDAGSGIDHYEMLVVAQSDGQVMHHDLNATSPWVRNYYFRRGDTLKWTLTAVDGAGNTTEKSGSWIQDNSGPTVAIESGPSGVISDPTFTFTFSSSDVSDYHVTCYLAPTPTNRPNAFVDQDNDCTSPKSYDLTGYADGEYTFYLYGRDGHGNWGPSVQQTFVLDRTP